MLFQEKKLKKGYKYKTKDLFGTIILNSGYQLKAEQLDDIVYEILKIKAKGKNIKGDIQGSDITYNFLKKTPWLQKKQSQKSTN